MAFYELEKHNFKKDGKLSMPVPFKIKVSKEILELSKECGTKNDLEAIGQNCAIALALKDIFPEVLIAGQDIYPFGSDEENELSDLKISMPKVAQDFIAVFDSLCEDPNGRLQLPEFEFEIFIPEIMISQIDIDEIKVLDRFSDTSKII